MYIFNETGFQVYKPIDISHFDISKGNIIYPDFEFSDEILYLNLNVITTTGDTLVITDLEEEGATGNNSLIANDHIYYIKLGNKLIRSTIYNHESKQLLPDIRVCQIQYCNDYIYFMDEESRIGRVKADGSGYERIAQGSSFDSFRVYDDKLVCISEDFKKLFLINEGGNTETLSVPETFGEGRTGVPNLIGMDDTFIYLFAVAADSGNAADNVNIFKVAYNGKYEVISSGKLDYYYAPEVIENNAYYYFDGKLYCKDTNTMELSIVGDDYKKQMFGNFS